MSKFIYATNILFQLTQSKTLIYFILSMLLFSKLIHISLLSKSNHTFIEWKNKSQEYILEKASIISQ